MPKQSTVSEKNICLGKCQRYVVQSNGIQQSVIHLNCSRLQLAAGVLFARTDRLYTYRRLYLAVVLRDKLFLFRNFVHWLLRTKHVWRCFSLQTRCQLCPQAEAAPHMSVESCVVMDALAGQYGSGASNKFTSFFRTDLFSLVK